MNEKIIGNSLFCYCTSTIKILLLHIQALLFATCMSGILAPASAVAASHLLGTGGKGMKQECLNWKMLLSASVFCLVDCWPGGHLPMG